MYEKFLDIDSAACIIVRKIRYDELHIGWMLKGIGLEDE